LLKLTRFPNRHRRRLCLLLPRYLRLYHLHHQHLNRQRPVWFLNRRHHRQP
jgi:hypothetical protein